jgi:membrane protease YdiL (CAAX protease family)
MTQLALAFMVWGASVALLLILQFAGAAAYALFRYVFAGERPSLTMTPPLVLAALAGTLIAHILTMIISWWAVTSGGTRPFWSTLGWQWHHQFKWMHAVVLAVAMLALSFVLERVLPHGKTELERLLELSGSVRIAVALLAVLSAPLVEEVVYRGLLYSAIQRALNWRASVAIVTLLFAIVHVPQYWGSAGAIVAILSLSLVLTLLRTATGQLLPCVATHFVFNGVQAVTLLVSPPGRLDPGATETAIRVAGRWLGLDL